MSGTDGYWWWCDRWRRSTAYSDMTLEQQGAFRNLLDDAAMRGGGLPMDERILAKASGDALAWPAVREAVLAKFVAVEGLWRNETLDGVLGEMARRKGKQRAYRERQAAGEAPSASVFGNGAGNAGGNAGGNARRHPVPSTQDTRNVQEERTALAREAPSRASHYKRAVAIGFRAVELHPNDFTSQASYLRQKCDEQRLDWRFKNRDGREMWARVLDYVHGVLSHRKAAKAS